MSVIPPTSLIILAHFTAKETEVPKGEVMAQDWEMVLHLFSSQALSAPGYLPDEGGVLHVGEPHGKGEREWE